MLREKLPWPPLTHTGCYWKWVVRFSRDYCKESNKPIWATSTHVWDPHQLAPPQARHGNKLHIYGCKSKRERYTRACWCRRCSSVRDDTTVPCLLGNGSMIDSGGYRARKFLFSSARWQNCPVCSWEFLKRRLNRWGQAVAHLVEALRYKPEGCGLDSWWGHWDMVLRSTQSSSRNEYQGYFLGGKSGRCVGLTNLPPSCAYCLGTLGPSTSLSPKGLSRHRIKS